MSPTTPTPADWYRRLVAPDHVRRLLELCRDEDLGPNRLDPTAALMVEQCRRAEAWVVARRGGIVSGLQAVGDVLHVLAPSTKAHLLAQDGQRVEPGQCLALLDGPWREILAVERTLLNLLGRLSGVATETARYVTALGDVSAVIVDTRKTTPGLRQLEKYAVLCGGGHNHRMGLYDAVLIKDNHLAGLSASEAAQKVRRAAIEARRRFSLSFVEVEVDTIDQLEAMLGIEPGLLDIILLDNMGLEDMRQAVAMRDARGQRPLLEASGGIALDTLAEVAQTGIDRIAVGAITHHAVWLDIALDAGAMA